MIMKKITKNLLNKKNQLTQIFKASLKKQAMLINFEV